MTIEINDWRAKFEALSVDDLLTLQVELAEFLRSKITNKDAEKHKMAEAALALLEDYKTDSELTALTALDGEDFYA